jgi:ketosteroid isomerase-like protein
VTVLSDGDHVRNLLGRYCERIDAGDLDGVGALFGDDGVLATEDGTPLAVGAAAVAEHLRGLVATYDGSPRTKHLVVDTVLEPGEDGTTMSARSSYVVLQATDDLPLQPIIAGRYLDRFRREERGGAEGEEGGWRWVERRYLVDLLGDLRAHLGAFGDRLR